MSSYEWEEQGVTTCGVLITGTGGTVTIRENG